MIEIRSYRRVFALERRIYRVDRLRLNPGGVPVRGILYFVALLAASLLVASVPVLGVPARVLPWYLRAIALPGATATVLSVIRIEGRPFHLAAYALVRYRCCPRESVGACRALSGPQRWCPEDLLLLPDGSDASMRRLRYTGPGAVLVAVEHDRSGRVIERGASGVARRGLAPKLIVRERPDARALERGQVISLEAGVRLLVRSRPSTAAART